MTEKITIPVEMLSEVKAALEKLIKRAVKLGVEQPQLKVSTVRQLEKRDAFGKPYKAAVCDIEVIGEPIKLPGYSLVARLEREKGGNLIFTVPGKTLDEAYRNSEGYCDHCKTKRDRKRLFVFDGPDGKQTQIGSNCLRDFMGVDPNRAILASTWASTIKEIGEESWGGSNRFYASLASIIATASAVIEYDGGYISQTAAGERHNLATSSHVYNALYPSRDSPDDLKYASAIRAMIDDARYEAANKCIAYIRDEWKNKTDYAHNLRVIAANEVFTNRKGMSFAISMWPTYQREMGYLVEKKLAAESNALQRKNSDYVGKLGDKLKMVPVTNLIAKFVSEGAWGPIYLYKFVDEAGNLYTWFSGGKHIDKGDTGLLNGTVKAFKEYNGIKETQLTRCRFKLTKKATDMVTA